MDGTSWMIRDGTVLCEGMSLEHLRRDLQHQYGPGASPVFVYSRAALVHNVRCYLDALSPMGAGGVLAYSLKANGNPRVAATLLEAGVQRATCVSGNEMKVAIKAGFPSNKLIFNGNGKRRWEVEEAVRSGSLLNVDSMFDARRVVEVATEVGVQAKLLLRLNPAIDALTHPYLSTALADCKFGVEESQVKEIQKFGWHDAALVNLGGGLGVFPAPHQLPGDHPLALIDNGTPTVPTPTPADLVKVVLPLLPEGATLILEPGRSLVASAGVLMTEILGVKTNGGKVFVVTDAAMTEVIRPALYGSKHPVTHLTQPKQTDTALEEAAHLVDVVGPVCESGDFLARECRLSPPVTQGDSLLVWMTGAYCFAMASNYNMRPHALEVMVHGSASYKVIRRPQNFDDLMKECQ
ncbi:uncharacterized protein LOC135110883 isoform X3 [Scylla paramamosain]|uniref:uncharacterized protein LOC135110883 isoform X3 n=1 Tax=Scylla paramamosain TaxID=85552 RepID=UPI00308304E4